MTNGIPPYHNVLVEMSRGARGPLLVLAALVAVGAVGAAARSAPTRDAEIAPTELSGYPPLVLVWGDARRARQTATGDLYVARADGSGVRRVRAWPPQLRDRRVYGARDAAWSPDRRQIALLLGWWCGDPCFRLARVSLDGRRMRNVNVPADVRGADWSSGWRAVVTTFRGDDLWTVAMNGGRATRIWHSRGGRAEEAAWSPRGGQLAVATRRGILRMTRAGRQVVPLTRSQFDTALAWAPNGRRIAFIRQPRCIYAPECDAPADVFVVGANGRGLRRVTTNDDPFDFVWSPDSRSIVFTAQRVTEDDVNYAIKRVDADGRGLRALTAGPGDDVVAVARDGRKILFTRDARDRREGQELWVMDADGGRQTRLPLYRPGWSFLSVDWG